MLKQGLRVLPRGAERVAKLRHGDLATGPGELERLCLQPLERPGRVVEVCGDPDCLTARHQAIEPRDCGLRLDADSLCERARRLGLDIARLKEREQQLLTVAERAPPLDLGDQAPPRAVRPLRLRTSSSLLGDHCVEAALADRDQPLTGARPWSVTPRRGVQYGSSTDRSNRSDASEHEAIARSRHEG